MAKKRIAVNSLKEAINELHAWRKSNDSQACMHLIHLLAAKYAGGSEKAEIEYTEQSVDFVFCDTFFRVNNTKKPYFDPLDLKHRIESHPHSNVATARKKTFSDSWKAGQFINKDGKAFFKFAQGYIDILIDKMKKGQEYKKLPVRSLIFWLYREREFDSDLSLEGLASVFKSEFNFTDYEFSALFETHDDDLSERGAWDYSSNISDFKLLIDVLTHDVDNFDLFNSLTAIHEVNNMPSITPAMLKKTMLERGCRQVMLQGPPGTGKTWIAKQAVKEIIKKDLESCRVDLSGKSNIGNWAILQFHPSYSYEDFIQRLVPVKDKAGDIELTPKEMPFLIACEVAKNIAPEPFVLIVDEINRADLQKVFGELMYALEYRDEPITTQYSDSAIKVPENLFLIGTMNTADSSVVRVDYAIRRRFHFFDVLPDENIIEGFINEPNAKKMALELFRSVQAICQNNPKFSLGHTYFLKNDTESLAFDFVYKVLPILRAYSENGVIPSDVSISIPHWNHQDITPWPTHPEILIECLIEWAGNNG